ncbi:Uncharacterized protein FWK35_00036865, partial [Aphis craccivora]
MTHFRKLVALVLREFAAQCLGKLILFGGRVIERPFTAMLPIHTHAYNLQRDHWKSRSNNSSFTPHVETLQEMDQVFVDNNFPLTPFSHIELPPQRRRTLMDDFQSYSPPRRVRKCHRHSVIDQTETASSTNTTCPADMKNERKRDVPERDYPDIQDVVCAYRDDAQLTPDVACSQETFQNRP